MTTSTDTDRGGRTRILYEVLFVALGYLVYSQVRGLAGDRVYEAFINAYNLVHIERELGIFREVTLQRWVLPNATLVDFFNMVYFWLFFPFVIPSAIWLYIKRPRTYELARNAFLISGAIAVIFFLLLPTAPPRFLGHMGFIDTLNQSFTPSYSSIPGVNHYAAVPSMHVGWTFLLAVALYQAFKGWPVRGVVFAIPALMWTATIVTGNHYFLDGVLGLLVALVALRIALVIQRRGMTLPAAPALEYAQLEAPSSQ
ncbi:MAG TPA: phosphatase PAP2 family protein [Dehalococcoidia bacterium]|nr:phosphatase PAP2 family protein [Dehalococcoidia bacterium]